LKIWQRFACDLRRISFSLLHANEFRKFLRDLLLWSVDAANVEPAINP